jgi:hypothetical protein
MKFLSSIIFTLFLLGALAVTQAEAGALKGITIVFDRSNGYNSTITLQGDGINVTGQYSSLWSHYMCSPCTGTIPISLHQVMDGMEFFGFSGTIDGTFYPNLYFMHALTLDSPPIRFPLVWNKTVRVSAPVQLTGNVSIWKDSQRMQQPVFREDNVQFAGTGTLMLRWYSRDNGGRLFWDKYLSYTLSAME